VNVFDLMLIRMAPVTQPPYDLSVARLNADPYSVYETLRRTAPVAWVPALGRYLVTRHEDVLHVERHPEVFSSQEQDSLMTRAIGNTLLRKDGDDHRRERAAAESVVRPATIRDVWMPLFERNCSELIDDLGPSGEADLFTDFAARLAARNLGTLLGLRGATDADLQEWSQAVIDACGNYANDPQVWERNDRAVNAVDAAVDEVIPALRQNPDSSVISAMLHAADPLTDEEIRTNVKIFIGGGINEPRDSTATAIYALLRDSELLSAVLAEPGLWKKVFEETVRWVSPIGMYPRVVTEPTAIRGVALKPGDRLGVVIASANRDEEVFTDPDTFRIDRSGGTHVGFGGGPHYCLGTWVARAAIGQIALPSIFSRLPNLRLTEEPEFSGWVFRGPTSLRVTWGKETS
jgi:cytochrome P450